LKRNAAHYLCSFISNHLLIKNTFMAVRNLDQQPGRGNEGRSNDNSSGNRSGIQEQQDLNVNNPQRGSEWNNYQTKELSANEESGISAEEAAQAFDDEDE
jgi:hypothetical protein